MRVNPNLAPDLLTSISAAQQAQATALQQIATGRRVNLPSDDPAAASALVQNHNRADMNDQYTQSGNTVLGMMQTAESVLTSVVNEVSQAVSVGVEGANGTLSNANRQTLAQQVSGALQSVVSQANTAYRGIQLFAGTATTTVPFTVNSSSSSGYQYNGNSNVNSVMIGDGYEVQMNLPGDQVFQQPGNDVLGSLQNLVTALQSGDSTTIGAATNQLRSALDYVTQQRSYYGNVTSQLNTQETVLPNEKVISADSPARDRTITRLQL